MSFTASGLLEQISKSTKYVPDYVLKDQMKKEAIEIGEKKGADKKSLEIALQMRKEAIQQKLLPNLPDCPKK